MASISHCTISFLHILPNSDHLRRAGIAHFLLHLSVLPTLPGYGVDGHHRWGRKGPVWL